MAEQCEMDSINKYGQVLLSNNKDDYNIKVITIIGEIEGHEASGGNTKSTKYEHLLPLLIAAADNKNIDGILYIMNTVGGDVSCGLAIAEMIASIDKPNVSLVIGDSHSIGIPLAVASKYSYIVPSGTMIVHPVRLSGTIIGAQPTYDYFKMIEDRIASFVAAHSDTDKESFAKMMVEKGVLAKDLGTVLVGYDAVKCGLINEVGGLNDAMNKLKKMIAASKIDG